MVIGVLHVALRLDEALSLKDKRVVLNRLREKIRAKFNVSIAEVDMQNIRNYACLAVVIVSNEQKHCNQVLSKVEDFIEVSRGCEIDDVTVEIF